RLLAANRFHVCELARLVPLLDPLGARAATLVHEVAPERVDRPVVDDAEHPGAHAAPLALVANLAAPDREECLLHDVLGHGARAHHPVGEREGGAAMAV